MNNFTPIYSKDNIHVSFQSRKINDKFRGKFEHKNKEIYPEPGTYLNGNPSSPTAVVIPMPDKEIIQIAIESGAAIAGSVVTANIGVEKVVANIVSNPNIRFIILFGRESTGHLSGHTILKLFENGIDENGRVIGSEGLTPFLKNLPHNAIKQFREQILGVVNLLGISDNALLKKIITMTIQEPENAIYLKVQKGKKVKHHLLYDPGKFEKEPLNIKVTEKLKVSGLYETLTPYVTSIVAPTISKAYPLVVEAIMTAGIEHKKTDERLSYVKELLNVVVHIQNPLEDMVPDGYRPEAWLNKDQVKDYLEKYSETYFTPDTTVGMEDNKIKLLKQKIEKSMEYTYGYFIQKHYAVKQILKVANEIEESIRKGEPSRRILISLPDPKIFKKASEVPCFVDYQLFPRFNEKEKIWELHATAHMRSHDAQEAFPANMYAFAKILEKIALTVGIKPGNLTVFFGSCHIYLNR